MTTTKIASKIYQVKGIRIESFDEIAIIWPKLQRILKIIRDFTNRLEHETAKSKKSYSPIKIRRIFKSQSSLYELDEQPRASARELTFQSSSSFFRKTQKERTYRKAALQRARNQ